MAKSSHTATALLLAAVFLLAAGCGPASTGQGVPPPQGNMQSGPPGSGGVADNGGTPTNVKQVMSRIGKGPQGLHNTIGEALKGDQPAWDTIQPQAKDYAQLAGALAKMGPPKGSKESWEKQTADYAASAVTLDAAIQSKDRDAAKAAHTKLTTSCTDCHKEFRAGRPG